ncbi:MAG TPA: LLM class F420-dependent oxidoreductase [Candidatus Dormibacteraeota bacterium]|nr:LLM class F420-dependent oxidoreductase [Candidatus Dormibacteraeota bacterium]
MLGDQIRFGVYSGPQHASFADCLALWQRCEELGYDWVSVFDHFMPIVGDPDGPCFEGPTMMAAMAAHTTRVRVAILVTGVTYRHPAVGANIAAAIDHISGGRCEYGVGAAWFEREHRQYGIPFPRLGVRMDMLDEACRVMRGLWTEERFSFEGKHFTVTDAQLDPKPLQPRLPLIIGGEGEKRTLRIVAEHADVWNTGFGDIETFRHKLDVLSRHCADVGRDPAEIRKSLTFRAVLAEDEAALEERRRELAPTLPIEESNFLFLTPEQCVERMRPFVELGAGDFLLAAYAPYDWQSLELVGREVAPAVRA